MARRLPIYFLVDVSDSMVGEPIQLVEEGIQTIIKELKKDPHALETVYISVVVFAGQAKTIAPLVEIGQFYPPKLPIGSGTSLGMGLGQVMHEMRRNVVPNSPDRKGDWKPIVFLLTDGSPTDPTEGVFGEWKRNWQNRATLVAISLGDDYASSLLKELTWHVLQLRDTRAETYREFFKWVTNSIKSTSVGISNSQDEFVAAKTDEQVLEKIDMTKTKPTSSVDTNFAILMGRCQNNSKKYLIKYKKTVVPSELGGNFSTQYYRLNGAYPIDETYFDLSDSKSVNSKIDAQELHGSPNCPCCGNQFGMAICQCGQIHCIDTSGSAICPWCGNHGQYGFGEGSINVDRTQG